MKRVISVIAACVMVLGLAACGGKEVKNAAVCKIEQNGAEIEMVLDAKGDKITKINQTVKISIEGYSEEQVQSLQDMVDQVAETYKEIDGITYEIEQDNTEIAEKISMDVENKDTLKAVIEAGLLPVEGDNVTKLSLKSTKEALEKAGWTVE